MKGIEYVKSMSGSEIAREMGISRQAVSQALKRSIGKVYTNILNRGIADDPIEAVLLMRELFNITDDDDIKQFVELFPNNIQKEIDEHVKIHPESINRSKLV